MVYQHVNLSDLFVISHLIWVFFHILPFADFDLLDKEKKEQEMSTWNNSKKKHSTQQRQS